jgi:hypothetical protein
MIKQNSANNIIQSHMNHSQNFLPIVGAIRPEVFAHSGQ